MALYGEIALRAHLGRTRIDIQVDTERDGLHLELWRHSVLTTVPAAHAPQELGVWFLAVLEALQEHFTEAVAAVECDSEAQEPAADDTTSLDSTRAESAMFGGAAYLMESRERQRGADI